MRTRAFRVLISGAALAATLAGTGRATTEANQVVGSREAQGVKGVAGGAAGCFEPPPPPRRHGRPADEGCREIPAPVRGEGP